MVTFNKEWYKNLIANTNEKDVLISQVSKIIGNNPHESCLDIGLGVYPFFAEAFSSKFKRYVIVEKEEIRTKLPRGVNLIKKDWESVDLNEKFDIIIASHVVYYFKNKKNAIEKMFSHLNEGGRIIFAVNGKEPDYGPIKKNFSEIIGKNYVFTYDELLKLLSEYKVVEYSYPSEIHFKDFNDLFEALRITFDHYPMEYENNKKKVIDYLKNNVKNKFIIHQKLLEVSLDKEKINETSISLGRLKESSSEKEKYKVNVLGKSFIIHPNIFSPKYFSDTEYFAENISIKKGEKFLEIGCGSGIISIFAALNGASEITAIDISPYAVENTKENAKLYRLENKISIYEGDVYSPLSKTERFDTIFWNIPFMFTKRTDSITHLEKSVLNPNYDLVKKFLEGAKSHLLPKGKILMGFSKTYGNYPKLKAIVDNLNLKMTLIKSKKITYDPPINTIELDLFEIKI